MNEYLHTLGEILVETWKLMEEFERNPSLTFLEFERILEKKMILGNLEFWVNDLEQGESYE